MIIQGAFALLCLRAHQNASRLDAADKGAYTSFMPAIDPADVKLCAQNCAAANVRRASRAVTKLYGQFMAATGLEPTQYSLLVACALTGGATVSKLADAFVMDRSALARNLAIMEKRGLVKVRPGEDRRTRRVSLTPFGEVDARQRHAALARRARRGRGDGSARSACKSCSRNLRDLMETYRPAGPERLSLRMTKKGYMQ